MKDYIRELVGTAIFRHSSITFTGSIVNGFLGALFYILAARILGPTNFGLLSIAIATTIIVADIADFGMDSGMVRFVSQHIQTDKELAFRFLKLALDVRLLVSLVIIILGWILAPEVANIIFQKNELVFPLRLAFLGVGSAQLFSFTTSAFQSLQRFSLWSGVLISTNTVRLLLLLFLWFLGMFTLTNALVIYITLPFLGFLAGLIFLPKKFLRISGEFSVSSKFFHFSKWVALSTILAALSSRLDTFISARLLDASQIGFYAASGQLVAIVPQIVSAFDTVMAPKAVNLKSKTELINFFKNTQVGVSLLALVGILMSPIMIVLIPIIYGEAYALVVPRVFLALLAAMIIFLLSIPTHSIIIYYFSYPRFFVFITFGQLLITIILGWWLISTLGIMGAAITVLAGAIFGLVVPLIWVSKKLSSMS